jgi:signal transduction histidine kinase
VEEALKKSERHYGQLLEQSRQMQERLRFLSHQILSAQEEERKEISRQLHDEIAQTLTGINVHLATLKKEAVTNAKGLTKKITNTQRLVEKSMQTVHRFARELRPTLLDDLGLIPALHSYLRDLTKRTGLRVQFSSFTLGRLEELDNAKRTVLYRVAQEALTNVARHAKASLVKVTLRRLRGIICMEIVDNGRSFRAERLLSATQRRRLGLLCMRERVEMVGGTFSIETKPGQGTTIRAEVPFGNGIKA